MPDARRHAPATARNREPILEVLQATLPARGLLLEIASGTGEHAAFMAPRLGQGIEWQPTDANEAALADIDAHAAASGCGRIRPALLLDAARPAWPVAGADAVLCCNMIHIAPWSAAEGLVAGAARILPPGAPLILYGPFRRHGAHTAPSNADFDAGLRARDPRWGVRCLDTELRPLAVRHGLEITDIHAMPANNLTVVLRRAASGGRA
jgi:SAM-dependent methyltransferase